MKIVVTGATGFIGRPLVTRLNAAGHAVEAVGRARLEPSALSGIDAVIHLAGEPIVKARWSDAVKASIRDSRVQGTRALVEAMGEVPAAARPRHFISASAIGFYGNRGDELLTERSNRGAGFLAEVVSGWEAESARVEALGVRGARLRFGVVLGRGGGALSKMQPIKIGSGGQWISWVHIEDLISAVEFVLAHPELHGVINVTAPEPLKNREFSRELACAKHWPRAVPFGIPSWMLRIALGEMSSLLLEGQRVIPEVLLSNGFRFRHERVSTALQSIFS